MAAGRLGDGLLPGRGHPRPRGHRLFAWAADAEVLRDAEPPDLRVSTVDRLRSVVMRLEHLCDVELHYDGPGTYAVPFGGEGVAYGTGTGTFSGTRLAGTFTFANRAHLRGDGVLLPAIDGVLTTGAGAVVVRMDGRVVRGRQVLPTTFVTDSPGHAWLNEVVAVLESVVDHESGVIRGQLLVCVNEG